MKSGKHKWHVAALILFFWLVSLGVWFTEPVRGNHIPPTPTERIAFRGDVRLRFPYPPADNPPNGPSLPDYVLAHNSGFPYLARDITGEDNWEIIWHDSPNLPLPPDTRVDATNADFYGLDWEKFESYLFDDDYRVFAQTLNFSLSCQFCSPEHRGYFGLLQMNVRVMNSHGLSDPTHGGPLNVFPTDIYIQSGRDQSPVSAPALRIWGTYLISERIPEPSSLSLHTLAVCLAAFRPRRRTCS